VEGMAGLLAYDASREVGENEAGMRSASEAVVCGEVTQAVRDTESDAGPIREGDWLGIGPDGISVVAASLTDVLCELVDTLSGDEHEILTVVEGQGAKAEATDALRAWVSQHRSALEIEVHQGGQPLYPYLIGVE
jgi:dihydroxyacetone kinase-like predicted kinase